MACLPNCLICDNFGCNLCERGYGVEDGICVPCSKTECPRRCKENCETCGSDLTCTKCVGSTLPVSSPVCPPWWCLLNCAVLGSQYCLQCKPGYQLHYITSKEGCCKKWCKFPALKFAGDGTALKCKDGFALINGCCELLGLRACRSN